MGCLFSFCPSLSHQDQTVSVGTKYTGRLTCFNLPLPPVLSWVSCWMTGFLIFPFHPLIIIWDGCMALPALWISSSCCYECQQFLNGSHGLALYWSLPCCIVLRNGHSTEYKSYQSSEFNFLRFSLCSLGIHRAIGLPACQKLHTIISPCLWSTFSSLSHIQSVLWQEKNLFFL